MKGYAVAYSVGNHRVIMDAFDNKLTADSHVESILNKPEDLRRTWCSNPRVREIEVPSIISSSEGFEDTPIGPVAFRETLIAATDQFEAEKVFIQYFSGHQYSSISGTGEENSILYTVISD